MTELPETPVTPVLKYHTQIAFYVAGLLADRAKVARIGQALQAHGWEWTFDWTTAMENEDGIPLEVIGGLEIRAVQRADVVIVVAPGGRGTHCELGAANALGIPVVMWIPPGVDISAPYPCPFHHCSNVEQVAYETVEEVVAHALELVETCSVFVEAQHLT